MGDGITVLYLDGDPGPPDITDVQRDDFGVVTAEDGEEVLRILEDTDIDCVVSDHDIPRVDGLEVLKEVRNDHPDLPFVLFVENGSEEVASDAISKGVTDYVQKEGEKSYGHLHDSVRNAVERYHAERELRESEEKYSTLVENANAGVFILQSDEVKFVNSRFAEIFGAEKEEMIGKDPKKLIAPEDRQKAMDIYRRRLRGEDVPETHEDKVLTVDGETKHVGVNASVITYEGEPASLGVLRDITEQKERERELERQNERLEEFASVVSHDLRNPLTVAKGQLELGRRRGDEKYFDKAEKALDRMDDLIDDVLTLAREGQRVSEKHEAALRSIVKKGWRNIDTENADLEVVESGSVRADSDRLCRMFENLFRNAVEHNEGDVTVRVGTFDGGFYVEDDGRGILPDERDEVFEYGYTTGEGTGLGLSIVETIVEAHGWEISVAESDEGGARFEVTGVES